MAELIKFLKELILLEDPQDIKNHYKKIIPLLKLITLNVNSNSVDLNFKGQIIEDLKLYCENPNFGRDNIVTTITFLKTL